MNNKPPTGERIKINRSAHKVFDESDIRGQKPRDDAAAAATHRPRTQLYRHANAARAVRAVRDCEIMGLAVDFLGNARLDVFCIRFRRLAELDKLCETGPTKWICPCFVCASDS